MTDCAISIKNLKKQYRLGTIGGGTLTADLQSWWARKRHREDPNLKIGETYERAGDFFWALKGIDLDIRKGEALGIVGANGAGKSTLLKILSRITAPTEGDVWINGRISSMLEVGTGFHGELTGRENIYLNGAILGMRKSEVDAKMESIIDFSECRQFIDTPVKRYSSGMYVKLAFAVASHLDSEILIMDEVLAVGDMAFQKKSLTKMGDATENEGRTVLYVSHNMATIRSLCTKCVILDKGELVFHGDVEEAIALYMNRTEGTSQVFYDYNDPLTHHMKQTGEMHIKSVTLPDKSVARYLNSESLRLHVDWEVYKKMKPVKWGLHLKNADESTVGFAETNSFLERTELGTHSTDLLFDLAFLGDGAYVAYLELYYLDCGNGIHAMDQVGGIYFEVVNSGEDEVKWLRQYWGSVRLNKLVIEGQR